VRQHDARQGAVGAEVAGHLGDVPETIMRTYAHWPRDDRQGLGSVLDEALALPVELVTADPLVAAE
jgi:hypothetical protein